MRIALVSGYDLAFPGGVADHVRHLAVNFHRLGHAVCILAPWSGKGWPAIPGVPVHRFGPVVPVPANGSIARITFSPLVGSRVQRFLRSEPFDIVHVHEPLLPALPLIVLRHSRSVNVGTFHAYSRSSLGYFYGKPILRYFFRRLHGRIAVSEPARDFIARHFDADYAIIPNGIDTARFGRAAPIPLLADGRPNILFVGRFNEPRKGFKFLLRALTRVRQVVPAVRLVVVGQGDAKRYRRFLAARRVDDVIFAGRVPDADLPRYYASCDVFCAPSIGGESFGVVLLEAMASGRPVVATNIAGYASVVQHEHNGLLVPPKDPAALAAALVGLVLDPDRRRRMGECGRLAAGQYDWETVSRSVLRYYTDVAVPARRLAAALR